jgi:hypothetical protein
MLHHSDSCSLFRNGKRLPENITEDQRVDWLDVSAKKTSFHITIASYIARASRVKKDALLADPIIREVLFEDDVLAEITVPDNSRLIRTGTSVSALSHAKKRAFADLADVFKPIIQNNGRSAKSYRCELAAIVIATYGKLSSIPKAIWLKIENIFGHEIIQDPETAAYRKQMSASDAKNWFRHMADIEEIFDFASIDKNDVVTLSA